MPISPPKAPSRSQRAQQAVRFPARAFLLQNKIKINGVRISYGLGKRNRARSREVASVVLIRSELQTKSPVIIINLEPGPEVGEY